MGKAGREAGMFSFLSSFSSSPALDAVFTKLISTFGLRTQILQLSSGGYDSKADILNTLDHIKGQAAAEPKCYPYEHWDFQMCLARREIRAAQFKFNDSLGKASNAQTDATVDGIHGLLMYFEV